MTLDLLLENTKHQKNLIHAERKWRGAITVCYLLVLKALAQWECLACWGSEPLVIPPATGFPGDLSYTTAALIFLEYKDSAKWSAELLVAGYHGELKTYLVLEQSKACKITISVWAAVTAME